MELPKLESFGLLTVNQQIDQLDEFFRSHQLLCKNEFDKSLNDFNELISYNKGNENVYFDSDRFYKNDSENQIEYIDFFRINSFAGQTKHKLNQEIRFFTQLKQIRLDYMQKISQLRDLSLNVETKQSEQVGSTSTSSPTMPSMSPSQSISSIKSSVQSSCSKQFSSVDNLNHSNRNPNKKASSRTSSQSSESFVTKPSKTQKPKLAPISQRFQLKKNSIADQVTSRLYRPSNKQKKQDLAPKTIEPLNIGINESDLLDLNTLDVNLNEMDGKNMFLEESTKTEEIKINILEDFLNKPMENESCEIEKKSFGNLLNSDMTKFKNSGVSLSTISNCTCCACASCIMRASPIKPKQEDSTKIAIYDNLKNTSSSSILLDKLANRSNPFLNKSNIDIFNSENGDFSNYFIRPSSATSHANYYSKIDDLLNTTSTSTTIQPIIKPWSPKRRARTRSRFLTKKKKNLKSRPHSADDSVYNAKINLNSSLLSNSSTTTTTSNFLINESSKNLKLLLLLEFGN